jgi:hypothetical protein
MWKTIWLSQISCGGDGGQPAHASKYIAHMIDREATLGNLHKNINSLVKHCKLNNFVNKV